MDKEQRDTLALEIRHMKFAFHDKFDVAVVLARHFKLNEPETDHFIRVMADPTYTEV